MKAPEPARERASANGPSPLRRGSVGQRLRLATGLILFTFAGTHFFNHALGLISLDAMLAFDGWRTAITRSAPGTVVLVAALLFHVGSALTKLAGRRTLRLPAWEWLQLALGLAIPALLLPHIVNTRVSNLAFGIQTTYPYELAKVWKDTFVQQSLLLGIVWLHGCIGLHYALRLLPGYRRLAPHLLGAAVLLPFAAFAGVVTQGREMAQVMADPARFAALRAATHWPDAPLTHTIVGLRADAQIGFYALLLGAMTIGLAVTWRQRRSWRIPVRYASGPTVMAPHGPTLLEVSRMHGIEHMSVCGGRARCSTCRVRVLSQASGFSPPTGVESATLRAIHAPANVRLACQARVHAAATVMPLVNPRGGAPLPAFMSTEDFAGVERELAVLFIDIRGFTAMTDRMLAYDVVYVLNEFFQAVGVAVQASGGWINDRAGDGALALFADPLGLPAACRAALQACAAVDLAVDALNLKLQNELAAPLRVAMGLHCGPHVVGRLGVAEGTVMSVIGPAVNIASRLEAQAKAQEVQLALSAEVARQAGLDTAGWRTGAVALRGLAQPLEIVLLPSARRLLPPLRSAVAGSGPHA